MALELNIIHICVYIFSAAKNDNSSEELVVFNILAGDLNFDNVSECHRNEQQSQVMQHFK